MPSATPTAALEDLSEVELKRRQDELETKLQRPEQGAAEQPAADQRPSFDLSGVWSGPSGLTYQVVQNGSVITIQEFNPFYGVLTAVGQGVIRGESIRIQYQTPAYTQGMADLRLSGDGSQMSGTLRDNTTGMVTPVTLQR